MLDLFHSALTSIQENYSSLPLFIGGDFNARVADLNQLDSDLFHDTLLYPARHNQDYNSRHVILEVNGNIVTASDHFPLNISLRLPGSVPSNKNKFQK
uniref:Endonuclease/exonuclease/phosphatase domain-containing protein n=1 Tax=Rhodnius prolixus TaxID=13249 RepID=T1HQH2_RHOPR